MSLEMDMWRFLFDFETQSLSNATKIIRENLTFDNPGLFDPVRITSQSHRDELACCNLWLVHRYVYMMSDSAYLHLFDENLEIQKHILAAANLKQPWFFDILLSKYIELAQQLSNPDLRLPVSITCFRTTSTQLKDICATVEYQDISLQSHADVTRILKFTVLILEHFITDLCVMQSDKTAETVNTILEIFKASPLSIKVECLKFFYRFFKGQIHLKESSLRLFSQVIILTGAIFRNVSRHPQLNPPQEEWQTIDTTLLKLFEVIRTMPIVGGTYLPGFLQTVLEFQGNQKRVNYQFEHFPKSFPLMVRWVLEHGYDFNASKEADEAALLKYLSSTDEIWICTAYLKASPPCTEATLKESPIWKKLLEKSALKDPDFTADFLYMILQLNDKFEGGLEVFTTEYQEFATTVFALQTERLRTDKCLAKSLILAHTLLSVKDAVYLNDRTQQQLFEALLFGLEDVMELKFRPQPGMFLDLYEAQKELKDSETPMFVLQLISSMNKSHLSRSTQQNKLRPLMDNLMRKSTNGLAPKVVETFLKEFPTFLKNKHILFEDKAIQFLKSIMAQGQHDETLVHIFRDLICLANSRDRRSCLICSGKEGPDQNRNGDAFILEMLKKFLPSDDINIQLTVLESTPAIARHFPERFRYNVEFLLETALKSDDEILLLLAPSVPHLIPVLVKRTALLESTIAKLTELVKGSLESSASGPLQSSVLAVVREFSLAPEFELPTMLRFFKLTMIFLVREESKVVSEASLVCEEMCLKREITPRILFRWYKQSILELVVQLVVVIYLQRGIQISSALCHVSKLFDSTGRETFLEDNHPRILAHLLPFVVKYPRCGQILTDMSDVLQMSLAEMLTRSFLTIYEWLFLFLSESDEMHQKCSQLFTEATEMSVFDLLSTLRDKPFALFLMHYHRNPQCVTEAIKRFLPKPESCSLNDIVEFVATKFLGVLTLFENHLIMVDCEKSIKRDVLLSLGEIIRLMESKHITQFRFKIVSLLRTAVAGAGTELHDVCTKVWDIFVRNVDVQYLGPLLSTIVVSMEPLLKLHSREVNSILQYLIIENGNLLSSHLKDLFFVESLDIVEDVKQCIVQHNHHTGRDVDQFERSLFNFSNQINHDNLAVRIYGIKYLTELFRKNRSKVNRLIMGQPEVDEQMEDTLNMLIMGCKHMEENLQLAAGICLGEVGVVEPSYLQQNYAQQKTFCNSILSKEFAISTLADLCHAYQFLKDSKYGDCFSLAIQKILQYHEVDLKEKKQMEIWTAIPERMRQIMEPLLTSCYTNVSVRNYSERHPIFPRRTCSEWAYTWASNIIEHIENADIKELLDNFKPSMKNDAQIMANLMPYVILHGIQCSPVDRRERIREEFELLFKLVAAKEDEPRSVEFKQHKEIPVVGYVPYDVVKDTKQMNTEDVKEKCAKLAFNLLDFLGNWCHEFKQKNYKNLGNNEYKVTSEFLQSFDKKILAKANFNSGEHARALQIMEEVVVNNPSQLQSELSFMGQIYAELLDSDSLEGAMGMKTIHLNLSEQILLNNLTGKLNESAACYERMMQEKEMGVYDMKDMVQCYLGLDQPETALLICEGLMEKLYAKHAKDIPNEISAEALWRLGRFEEVEKNVKNFQLHDNENWGVRCGQLLYCVRKNDSDQVLSQTQKAREVILKSLRMTGFGENSYIKGYDHILKLHLITEIEKTFELFEDMQMQNYEVAPKQLDSYFIDMNERLDLFKNQKNIQTILCLRRILFTELNGLLATNCPYKDTLTRLSSAIDLEMGKSWITSTKVARKSGAVQQANLYILNCEKYRRKDLFLEKAKLLWEKGDQTIALQTLNRGMEHLLTEAKKVNFNELPQAEKVVFAKAKFLLATYNARSMNIQTDLNVQYFKDSLQANKESEICFVHYAHFLDKIYESIPESRKAERFELLKDIMTNYGNSMLYGFKFMYQSMPRMLSIWLDYTADKFSDSKSAAALTKIADGFSEKLPAFMYFSAFSQLVSRICHPSQDVYNVIKTILVKLVLAFPQQSLWMLLCVLKSSYSFREKKCAMVLDDRRLKVSGMPKLINDFNALAVRLIDLTKAEIKKGVTVTNVSELARDLPRIISDHNFSNIIIPSQKFMQPILPSPLDRNKPVNAYAPFPQSMAYIQGIDEKIRVLQSLQKPRRVNFKASDGLDYSFLLKPKDDLRRDFRLMEFNSVVKHYLNLDLEAHERRLYIRTYGVLPLNEEYGIIEWLENLQTFRTILGGLYKLNNCGMAPTELQKYYTEGAVTIQRATERYKTLLKRHPPIFDQWFKMNFTTSHNWYMARTAYVRTCAVMSVVGYVLGLGDRHCENILFDVTNGDTVHVDFNCLFNAGEKFAIPERVPFRLTQNMVHAMGPLGIEGPFRKSCEVTLRVMRAQQQTLMSVLRPFIYDPLVTWKKPAPNDGNSERTDPDAMNNVKNIEDRLKGFVKIEKKTSNMPLSTEGQVNFVIKEAMDVNNLAPMYIGWSPFM